MITFTTVTALKEHLSVLKSGEKLALVPTMGALHKGHLSLVKKALDENDLVVVSIFVNPTQFDNVKDLEKYPMQLEADIKLLKTVAENVVVFAPTVGEMYPQGQERKAYNFGALEKVMEGAFRDGHFDGVGTIVEKLLTIVAPSNAYFGEKDYQQLQIIKKLVEICGLDINIIGCDIVREQNGLALSSRNARLSEGMREEASFIYKTLKLSKVRFEGYSATNVERWVTKQFEQNDNFNLEYVRIANAKTLQPVKRKTKNTKYRIFIAAYTEGVRLIDNIALN